MTREEAQISLATLKRYMSGGGVVDRKADEAIDMAIKALEEPEIIRCKDCKRFVSKVWLTGSGSVDVEGHCGRTGIGVTPHYFCSLAERRTNESD